MKGFELLSRIYALLAEVDAKTLAEARRATSGPVARIVDAMTELVAADGEPRRQTRPDEVPVTRGSSVANGTSPRQGIRILRKALEPYPTNHVIEILQLVGLSVPGNVKSGRTKILERAERRFASLSPPEAERVLRELHQLLPTETEGWFNVVNGRR